MWIKSWWLNQPKQKSVAIVLALLGTITPIAGLQKIYLGQPVWGLVYFLLFSTPIPRIASAIDAVWYFVQDDSYFNSFAPASPIVYFSANSHRKSPEAIAQTMRELDQLRAEGLISEGEFEQKRRQLLEQI